MQQNESFLSLRRKITVSVNAREKLRKLIGLPEGKFLSDYEIEIEYETELAHLYFTRKWLVKAHEDWIAEVEAEKARIAASQDTEVKGCECKSERGVSLPDPHTLEIEFLNLSDKATANLKKVGIDMLSDCTAHSVAELQDLIGIKPTSIIEKALGRYGLGLAADVPSQSSQKGEAEEASKSADEGKEEETVQGEEKEQDEEDVQDAGHEAEDASGVSDEAATEETVTPVTAEAEADVQVEENADDSVCNDAEAYVETPASTPAETSSEEAITYTSEAPVQDPEADFVVPEAVPSEDYVEPIQEDEQPEIHYPIVDDGLDDDVEKETAAPGVEEIYGEEEVVDISDTPESYF